MRESSGAYYAIISYRILPTSFALNLKSETFENLLMIIWGLWTNRNTKLWEDKARSAADISLGCMTWLEEFQRSCASEASPRQPSTHTWLPSSANTLKLNIDGAFVSHLTKGGIGGIL